MSRNTGLNPRDFMADIFPEWEKPVPVSCFSINDERFYESDCINLRYLKLPEKLPIDLNVGVEFAKKKPDTDEALDHLLEHIMISYDELTTAINKNAGNVPKKQNMPLFPVEFVAWRGLLRRIMCTPFEYGSDWMVHVTRFRGIHYFCERETKRAPQKFPNDSRVYSWNYKFEQYCLTKSPEIPPDTNAPVDECSEFVCVFNTRLAGLNMIYGAEIDGIKSEVPVKIKSALQSGHVELVALKTDIKHMNDKQTYNFQCCQTRNWWCQSFLIGIDSIIVGWRNELGMVESIEEIKVHQLPKQSENWSPTKCAQFLINFLNFVKNFMSAVDCPYTVYEFRYDAKKSLITYDVFEGLTLKTILPDYYIDFITRIST